MSDYTLLCTEEQTKKAFELGAKLTEHPFEASIIKANENMFQNIVNINERYYYIPTAEQMISWLEEQYPIDHIDVYKQVTTWNSVVYMSTLERRSKKGTSRPEATLAAIDAALEHLRKGGKE